MIPSSGFTGNGGGPGFNSRLSPFLSQIYHNLFSLHFYQLSGQFVLFRNGKVDVDVM